jgi:hypothetical protein
VNPANVSDFKKALRRKQTMLLSEGSTPANKHRQSYFNPPGATQNAEIKYKSSHFVRLILSIYIRNVNLFGAFDPEKHRFQLSQLFQLSQYD